MILNIDLDIFSPEMDFIDDTKKMKLIKKLLHRAPLITIATSPFFIDQEIALRKLYELF
jgi:hypothetical protein